MKKDVTTTKVVDLKTTRVFVKGVEITELVKSIEINSKTEMIDHETLGAVDSRFINTEETILLALDLKGSVIHCHDTDFNMIIYIKEIPTDEFIAEMVRLKLRRAGIINENENNKQNLS